MRTIGTRRLALGLGALLMGVAAVLFGSSAAHRSHSKSGDPGGAAAFGALGREGLPAALDTLERLAGRDSLVLRNAHQLAHALGRRAIAAAGNDPRVLSECRPDFASGCYHGVVEGYLQARGRIDMEELERMCGARAEQGPGTMYECVHGLGHGILGAVGLDAPAALRYCDELSTPALETSCHQGVFMEAINAAVGAPGTPGAHVHGGSSHAGRLVLDGRDPYAPCDHFSDPYADSCWLFQGFLLLRVTGFDASRAFRACDAAPGGKADRCYESLGLQLAGLFQRDDVWLVGQCARGRPALAPHCAAGAALALAHIDWTGARAASFCAAAPAAWKEPCYRSGAGLMDQLATRTQRASLCDGVERDYVSICRRAAGLEAAN